MKFLALVASLILASPLALGATRHRTVDTTDEDSDAQTTTTTLHHHNQAESNAVVRDIVPEFGLVLGDQTINPSSTHTGLLIGGAVDLFKFGGNWTFESGLQYKQMGTSVPNLNSLNVTMNYLMVPLAAKYYFGGERQTGFYAKGGLVPGINVTHSYSVTDGNNNTTTKDIQDVGTFDLGILVGVGGKLMLTSNTALVLEANYVRGITGLYGPDSFGPATPGSVNQSVNDTSITFLTGVSLGML